MRYQPDNYDDLEAIADALLSSASASEGEYPAYSETYLAARERRRACDVSLEQIWSESSAELERVDEIVSCVWAEVMAGAMRVGLTERQAHCLRARREGKELAEIAAALNCSAMTVARDLLAAAKRLQRIPAFGLWTVLSEVFRIPLSEVLFIIRPPQRAGSPKGRQRRRRRKRTRSSPSRPPTSPA